MMTMMILVLKTRGVDEDGDSVDADDGGGYDDGTLW